MTRQAGVVDVVIVGGGCAGLSLGREIATSRTANCHTVILEPRSQYENDRTWCFWHARTHSLSHLVSHTWPAWRFSDGGSSVAHSGSYRYQCIRADDFYAAACDAIDKSAHVELRRGTHVLDIETNGNLVTLETNHGSIRARHVVDTRPPVEPRTARSPMFQVFAGAEIETTAPLFDTDVVGLMEQMSHVEAGLDFTYVLPFSTTRALIEVTRFSPVRTSLDSLRSELTQRLAAGGLGHHEVLRRESGIIPMGLPEADAPHSTRIVRGGTAGGAVRAATGYALLRIDNWSKACARRVIEGLPPVGHPREPRWRIAMDHLFSTVLLQAPERGPELFMSLARGTQPDALVRFLSDVAKPCDVAQVVRALPSSLFVKTALAELGFPGAGLMARRS
ncbi:MAG: lycopene cyclase family protein [Pseudomonadota bacterium]